MKRPANRKSVQSTRRTIGSSPAAGPRGFAEACSLARRKERVHEFLDELRLDAGLLLGMRHIEDAIYLSKISMADLSRHLACRASSENSMRVLSKVGRDAKQLAAGRIPPPKRLARPAPIKLGIVVMPDPRRAISGHTPKTGSHRGRR